MKVGWEKGGLGTLFGVEQQGERGGWSFEKGGRGVRGKVRGRGNNSGF